MPIHDDLVSIPKWCDSKQYHRLEHQKPAYVSIPKWRDSKYLNLISFSTKNTRFNSKVVRFKVKELVTDSYFVESFNSKVVRFKAIGTGYWSLIWLCFNSKVVRFKDFFAERGSFFLMFQFQSGAIQSDPSAERSRATMVSIPKWCDSKISGTLLLSRILLRFNSKVVRFKVNRLSLFSGWWFLFQFQSGAIQSNFHLMEQTFLLCFNSKVVRFKAFHRLKTSIRLTWFQFQSGAIQSINTTFQ